MRHQNLKPRERGADMNDKFVHTTVAQSNGVEHPVAYRVTFGIRESCGVLVEFPDGRSLEMSIYEWIAIGVHAVEGAAHTQDVAKTMQQRAIACQIAPLRSAIADLLIEFDRQIELRKGRSA